MPQELILVCAGAETARAKESGFPLLQFGLGIRPDGSLYRMMLSDHKAGCYLGVSDRGMERFSETICTQLMAEAEKINAAGIFADSERDCTAVHDFLAAMDLLCTQRKIPLFVPYCQADCVQNAFLVVDTALSGGSLWERFQALHSQYPGRIAADLRKISRDFLLPAPDTEGERLKDDAREALCARTGAQTFFSRELCARYFTYMDAQENGHFVLFDDADTLKEKCKCLDLLGISPIFARYAEVKEIIGSILH